jgi:hypothetical protein
MGLLSACGGSSEAVSPDESPALADAPSTLEGAGVSGRDEALRIVARGVVAPMYYCGLAQDALVRVFELRSMASGAGPAASAGDTWVSALHVEPVGSGVVVEGQAGVAIEAADHAEELMLRGEAGLVRAVVRLDHVAFGAAQIDGTLTLEVSRAGVAAGWARRCQAESLSIADGLGTRHWSYLDVAIDAQQLVQRLTVVSDLTVDEAAPLWIDVVSSSLGRLDVAQASAPLSSGRYVATGVTGFLKARLTLQVGTDGGWTVEVDNDKDDQIDFVVHASSDEVRELASAL